MDRETGQPMDRSPSVERSEHERPARSRPGARSRDGRGGGFESRHYGARRAHADTPHYEIVNIVGGANALTAEGPQLTCEESPLTPGCYATVVIELPASRAADGKSLARGFYAVFWPMDDDSHYAAGPRHIGPFPRARQALEFIRDAI